MDVIVFCYAHDKIYAIFGKKLCQNFDICQCTMVTKESNKYTVRFIALSRLILRSYHMFINDRMIYNLSKKCKFASSYLFICKEVIFTQKYEGKVFQFHDVHMAWYIENFWSETMILIFHTNELWTITQASIFKKFVDRNNSTKLDKSASHFYCFMVYTLSLIIIKQVI